MRFLLCLLLSFSIFASEQNTAPESNEKDLKRFEELTKIILEGAYKERKAAINEIVKLKINISIIQKRLGSESDPELKHALNKVVEQRIIWAQVKEDQWEKYPVFGMNDGGEPLYLVKAKIDGKVVIGKAWKSFDGHFPHDGKEVLVKDYKIWPNLCDWRSYHKFW